MTTASTPEGTGSLGPGGWVVSASHRSSAAIKPPQPFGAWHARRPGDSFTACGRPAAGWPLFWHLTLVQGRAKTCPECQRVTYVARTP